MTLYIGVPSHDHEGDDFESAVICASIEEAKAQMRDDYGDAQYIYRCEIGSPPKFVVSRHVSRRAPDWKPVWEEWA